MANKYWIGGGANTNWATSANWSLSSGGAAGGGIPTSADVANFTGVGVNANGVSTISATITVGGLIITSGFTGTITHNAVLTCSATLTLGANYTISGTSSMTINLATSMTSNGKTWPNNMTMTGASTIKTLVDNWTIAGTLTVSSTTVLNGNNLYVAGMTMTSPISGTTHIHFSGTGTWSGTQAIGNNVTFEGNTTITGTVGYSVGTMTYSSGTLTTTGSVLTLSTTPTLNTPGVHWYDVQVSNSTTITLNAKLLIDNVLSTAATQNVVFAGTYGWSCDTLLHNAVGACTLTLQEDEIYEIWGAISIAQCRVAATVHVLSSSATVKAMIYLDNDARCEVMARFTDIDAAAGRPINTFNGLVTDCINIFSYTDLRQIATTF